MDGLKETTFRIPAALARETPGLAMDVGGSVAKLVYISKKEWEHLQEDKTAKNAELTLLSCARTDLTKATARVRENGHVPLGADGGARVIITTGIGCHQFAPRISKDLNIKLNNVMEMDCFMKGFRYLVGNYSYPELIVPHNQEIVTTLEERIAKQMAAIKDIKKLSNMQFNINTDEPEAAKAEKVDPMKSTAPLVDVLGASMYPALMVLGGSATGYLKVTSDSYSFCDVSSFGGRTLLGLGSLLCGTKSYDELIDLAEKGNEFGVNTSTKAFTAEKLSEGDEDETDEEEQDVYAKMLAMSDKEVVCFGLGNAVGKKLDDFKREDLAAALVANSVRNTLQQLSQLVMRNGTLHVFLCGGQANRSYVRDLFTEEWVPRSKVATMTGKLPEEPQLHFMKDGSHVGALGALLTNLDAPGGTKAPEQAPEQAPPPAEA